MRYRRSLLLLAFAALLCGGVLFAAATAADGKKPKPDDNPYAPRRDLSPKELHALIEHMQDAPTSLHERPGFAEAMLEAGDRILAAKPDASERRFALLAKFDAMHQLAVDDEKDADKNLVALAKQFRDDKDAVVAKQAKFYLLERRVLAADDLPPEQLPKLLAEVKTALDGESLDHGLLRIASATVRMINRLNDNDLATRGYKEFGELFAKSDDADLSAYGRQIVGSKPSESFVGKPFPLVGTTLDSTVFDIDQYRGRVVLVDFWATGSGPCKEKLPRLVKLHEQFHKRGFEVVGVDLDQKLDELGKFLDDNKLPWVNLVGEKDGDDMKFPIAEKYEINTIPTTFLIGRDGRVVMRDPGDEELSKKIEELLAAKPAATKPAGKKKS
jgi:thiol-disulfide isomerase/thioredoxin